MITRSLLVSALLLAFGGSVLAGPLAFVPNEKSASISLIDTGSDLRQRDIAIGQRPRGIAGDASRLYLTDGKTGSLLIVDKRSGKLERSVRVGDSPEGGQSFGRWQVACRGGRGR